MRFSLSILFGYLCISLSAQTGWVEFIEIDAGFSARFPSEVRQKADSIKTPLGKLVNRSYFVENLEGPNYVYLINQVDYPYGSLNSDSILLIDTFFATTIEQATKELGGDLVYQSEIDQNGFRAVLFRIDFGDDKLTMKTKIVVIRNRYYSIQVISEKGFSSNEDSNFFLEKFQLLGS